MKYLPTSYAVKHNKLMQTNSFILQVTASNPPLLHSTLRPKIRFPLESPFLSAISSFRAPEQECGSAVLIPLRRLRRGSLLYTCYSFNKSSHSTRVTPCLKLIRFRLLFEAKENHNLGTYSTKILFIWAICTIRWDVNTLCLLPHSVLTSFIRCLG